MNEFYIETNSFAAPIVSDRGYRYVMAETPEAALETVARQYQHPAGLYAAAAYTSADAKNKGEKPLAMWLCNHEIAIRELSRGLPAYFYRSDGPGRFEVNGRTHVVDDPKAGRVVEAAA